jgi:hypothetical protein
MPLSTTDNFYIRAGDAHKGRGLFTSRRFARGENIYRFDYWSQELMPIHVTNHSCNPNATFDEHGMLIALRDIEAGEELTYDYLLHPIPASPWNFACDCGAKECIGWVEVITSF